MKCRREFSDKMPRGQINIILLYVSMYFETHKAKFKGWEARFQTVVCVYMYHTLPTKLCGSCCAPRNSVTVMCQCSNLSNNALSRDLVDTRTTHWQPLYLFEKFCNSYEHFCKIKVCVWLLINYRYILTAWSTNQLSTCHSPMTKEYSWQIINMSVMPFCHWPAACT